jgi:hypothetical protein
MGYKVDHHSIRIKAPKWRRNYEIIEKPNVGVEKEEQSTAA